jgi:hypothetical protein
MENSSASEITEIKNRITKVNFNEEFHSSDRAKTNPMLENILSEGGNDFYQYVSWIGLDKEPNLMVLSSMHHYYYDHDDLKGIRTLVNIKKLNQIKHLESFLHTLYRIMPSQAYFVGCFKSNNHNVKGISIYQSGKFLNGLINIFDTKNDRNISKKSAVKLLEEHGFKVFDITDLNGLTYFWSQNMKGPGQCQ